MAAVSESRQVESPTSFGTYRGGPISPCIRENSWGDAQEDTPEGSLGQESQSDRRVMSPPKHVAKLPYWSESWYCWYHCDLAHHVYSSYVCSLVSCLPPLVTPRFGSEAEPDVLFFLSPPRGYTCHP